MICYNKIKIQSMICGCYNEKWLKELSMIKEKDLTNQEK